MRYCPGCTASYAEDDYACPDCRGPLVPGPRREGRPGGLVELYRCWNGLEADRIVGVLEAKGIPARARSLGVAGYPLTIPPFDERRIAVDPALVDEARRVILQAIVDGVVSGDGAWLPR
jgi:hypothetical protein